MSHKILYLIPFIPVLGIVLALLSLIVTDKSVGLDVPWINTVSALWQALSIFVLLDIFIL